MTKTTSSGELVAMLIDLLRSYSCVGKQIPIRSGYPARHSKPSAAGCGEFPGVSPCTYRSSTTLGQHGRALCIRGSEALHGGNPIWKGLL